ncbi:dihydroxyacetone kinase transcriptional activator DhaS [Lachnoclostridium sp. An196]|uniref:dihydroxyacetone kinase transcriptional activator DhaS n=1 Tax=Lachnoclostridium sp. An196 TaxID=1965583 RepID=UPI000B37F0DB|nr:dihydroxyacetone kinase transcriptional activator DhaS [Lachnoclostridium sp. An196]OUP17812.1 dihydroxyacetone kinase transcriptional activator DhaS [Lachnoclostridium sp. An196]
MADSNITKKALAESMKTLLGTMPFSKISVSDICEVCGMNRKSFYYHFRDKYDLINWIFHTEFYEAACAKPYEDGWEFILGICKYFYSNHAFYKKAFEITGQNSFRDYFQEILEPILLQYSAEMFDFEDPPEFFITFISDALIISMIRWLSARSCMEPEEYVRQLRACCCRMI